MSGACGCKAEEAAGPGGPGLIALTAAFPEVGRIARFPTGR